jgi:hypothetical protein
MLENLAPINSHIKSNFVLLILLCGSAFGQINNPSGSGSGTVGNCSAAGNAYYSASGTTTSCDTNITDDGAGDWTFSGATPTLTTTTTNKGLTFTPNGTGNYSFGGPVSLPNGSATTCELSFVNGGICFYSPAASKIGVTNGTTPGFEFTNGTLKLASGWDLQWSSTTNADSGTADSGFQRVGAKTLGACSNSGCTDTGGLLLAGNACRITADVSLTVNTANSFCSWSLPAVAQAWAFSCDIQWAITAGSGTNTFALGVNASQTPTGTTNVMAQIYTALTASTNTLSTAALSASGATSILTSPTYTPAATVQFAHASGTVLASGTAGTFAVTATANGTTATAAVKAGSTCYLY